MEKQLIELMSEYGYQYAVGQLIRKGVRGFSSPVIMPFGFRDAFQAAEHLIPIIGEEYHNKLRKIGAGK